MAVANPITMPKALKGPSRRAILGGLPAASAALLLPDMFGTEPPLDDEDIVPHPVLALPFVRQSTEVERAAGAPPRNFWSVSPSWTFSHDCDTGSRYARLALEYMARHASPNILQWSIFDMIRQGHRHSGIEIAYLAHFAGLALAAYTSSSVAAPGDFA